MIYTVNEADVGKRLDAVCAEGGNISRSAASKLIEDGFVTVCGKAQPKKYSVKLGDEITIAFGTKSVTVRVLDIRETTKKSESCGMYELISESNE